MSEKKNKAAVAQIDAIWASYGGVGDAPPLIVSQDFFDKAVAWGFPAECMRVAPMLDESEK